MKWSSLYFPISVENDYLQVFQLNSDFHRTWRNKDSHNIIPQSIFKLQRTEWFYCYRCRMEQVSIIGTVSALWERLDYLQFVSKGIYFPFLSECNFATFSNHKSTVYNCCHKETQIFFLVYSIVYKICSFHGMKRTFPSSSSSRWAKANE